VSSKFEVQTALFSALTSSSTLMSAINNNIYDHMPDNSGYPYVALAACSTLPANRHGRKGWRHLFTFEVATQPGTLGSYTREAIAGEIDKVLNLKTFNLTTTAYNLVKGQLVSDNDYEDNDIWGKNITYDFTVHDSTDL